ncbi:uncharacterized protein LOC111300611 isoform X1 [Durio zibethinus]|uniref:Uncharacterized protein LOC111300611 isoform X1 n=1 Tax=Durio zibethinus TaxID=66656 RepID=A0A6P5ZHG3_DURZI|nr:uncharacterized protein LOC111300611 isoform X1 [Durio zibethinus]
MKMQGGHDNEIGSERQNSDELMIVSGVQKRDDDELICVVELHEGAEIVEDTSSPKLVSNEIEQDSIQQISYQSLLDPIWVSKIDTTLWQKELDSLSYKNRSKLFRNKWR